LGPLLALSQSIKPLKFWAEANLTSQSVQVIGDRTQGFGSAYNDAAAFSLGVGATWVLTLISTVAVIAMLIYGPRIKTGNWALIGGFVLGGATGNWIDRAFKAPRVFQWPRGGFHPNSVEFCDF